MKATKHTPKPVRPPSTYTISELSETDMKILRCIGGGTTTGLRKALLGSLPKDFHHEDISDEELTIFKTKLKDVTSVYFP